MKKFSYFPANVKIVRPIGTCTLQDFHRAIKQPKPGVRKTLEKIKIAVKTGNEAEKHRLKEHLFYFTPAVKIKDRRSYSGIESFTGLMPLDFDKLDPDIVVDFKHYLFETYKSIISCWISASGKGVRALINIPVVLSVDQFKSIFKALEYYEPENFMQFNGFDPITKNPTQPVFISYDPDILIRENAEMYMRVFSDPEKLNNNIVLKEPDNQESIIKNIVIKSLSRIINEGHPILRATSYALGGYVASGYISESTAIDFIENQINIHSYLSKKANVYKKTAQTMIRKGQSEPLNLNYYAKR